MDKRGKNVGVHRPYKGKRVITLPTPGEENPDKSDFSHINMTKKIRMSAWHPQENTFAVVKENSLFIYTEKRQSLDKAKKDGKISYDKDNDVVMNNDTK
jgi:hypothetical protein